MRKTIFGNLDAFDVASLINAARLKWLIAPVERATVLHPVRALFTDTELASLESETASDNHQIVVWGDLECLFLCIDHPEINWARETLNICITAVSLDAKWLEAIQKTPTGLMTSNARRKVIQESVPKLSLPGPWTRISQHFIHRVGSVSHQNLASWFGDEHENLGSHHSRLLSNNIQLSWPRTTFKSEALEQFQYQLFGWSLIKSASEQLNRELPMVARTSKPLPVHLLVMLTSIAKDLFFDFITPCTSPELSPEADKDIPWLLLEEDWGSNSFQIPLHESNINEVAKEARRLSCK